MKLFVTGGRRFHRLELRALRARQHRRPGHRVRQAHLRRQPREHPRRARRPPVPLRPGRHLRPGRRAVRRMARPRRGRPLRRRVARRPLDRRPVRVRAAPTCSARTCCATSPVRSASSASSTSPPTRSTARSRTGSFSEDDRLDTPLAVLGDQGRVRPDRARYHTTFGLPVVRHAMLEQLRAVPVPREAHPAVHHQPARRQAGAVVRRRRQRARLDPRRRPQPRRAPGARARATSARSTSSAPTTRSRIVTSPTRLLGSPVATTRSSSGSRPARTRPALRDRRSTRSRALGWQVERDFDDGLARTRSTGTAVNRDWWEPLEGAEPGSPDASARHRRRRAARARPGASTACRRATTSRGLTTRQLDVTDRDAVLGAIDVDRDPTR